MLDTRVIEQVQLQNLIDTLAAEGYQVIGPSLEQDAIAYQPVDDASTLPAGYVDEQAGGHYRLRRSSEDDGADRALFRYAVGPHSWKRYLFPSKQRLWRASRDGYGFHIEPPAAGPPKYAFLGVRACELAALRIQDRVFDNGDYADSGYQGRREAAFLIAVNCTRAGGTCFCTSMNTGPAVKDSYDLALTELVNADSHRFLVSAGSDRGKVILDRLTHRPAEAHEVQTAEELLAATAASMGRHMPADARETLARNPEHVRWREVAQRCLTCANCTMVCPTCFCSTVEDTTSLDGATAERWRLWDSCFTVDFGYLHGGSIRRGAAARYRQWITHKLSSWHDQFESSGCTGCGRCITWCPVGIDITEEVAAIQASEAAQIGGK